MTNSCPEFEDRLIRYARVDTQSDETSLTSPSTERQFDLLRMLVDELRGIGASDVQITDYGAGLATIPATTEGELPVMGWLADYTFPPCSIWRK